MLLALAGCGGGGGDAPADTSTPSAVTPTPVSPSASEPTTPTPATPTTPATPVASELFPLNTGDSWVYDLTSGEVTTDSGLTRSVASGPDASGNVTVTQVEGSTTTSEQYTRTDAGVLWRDPGHVSAYLPGLAADWPSWLLWSSSAMATGDTRTVDKSGDAGIDYDGDGKSEAYVLSAVQTYRGRATLTVLGQATEVSQYTNAYRIDITLSQTGMKYTVSATENVSLAAGLGVVQSDLTEVGLTGAVTKQQRLTLRSARVAGVDHSR
ncbi:MAG: hypothetical protein RI907_3383 [Pseudomonadota bacterium]|jgi:hypothetical protein